MARSIPPRASGSVDIDDAAAAINEALRITSRKAIREAGNLVDPRVWSRRYPRTATLVSSAAGFVAGFLATWRLARDPLEGEPEDASPSRRRGEARRRPDAGADAASSARTARVDAGSAGTSRLVSALALAGRAAIRAAARYLIRRVAARGSGHHVARHHGDGRDAEADSSTGKAPAGG